MAYVKILANGPQKYYKEGYVDLFGETGIRYRTKALYIHPYGWVPCSMKLNKDFTNDSKQLMLVFSEEDDPDAPVTSDIWVTRIR